LQQCILFQTLWGRALSRKHKLVYLPGSRLAPDVLTPHTRLLFCLNYIWKVLNFYWSWLLIGPPGPGPPTVYRVKRTSAPQSQRVCVGVCVRVSSSPHCFLITTALLLDYMHGLFLAPLSCTWWSHMFDETSYLMQQRLNLYLFI
jgi:hypothetical protein